MCDSKNEPGNWTPLPPDGPIARAIRDVLDNVGDQASENVTREWVRRNLLALVNITRQVTAREIYKMELDGAYREFMHHVPSSVKETLSEQEAAMKALGLTWADSTSSGGTSTGTDSVMPF